MHPLTSSTHARRVLCAAALLALGAACADPERLDLYDSNLQIEGPIQLEHHIAMLNRTLEEVVLISVDGADLDFQHVAVGKDPVALTATPDERRLAVLSRTDENVTVIDVGTGASRAYGFESAFDTLTFSPDGKYALAYYLTNGVRPADEFFNPLEYAVIDMEKDPSDATAVTSRSLRGFGETPYAVHFVPEFNLSGGDTMERYALFFFDRYVTFADLADAAYEVTVPFTLSPTQSTISPREVMFTDAGPGSALQDSFVYILATGSDDVYAINLLPGQVDGGKVRLLPNLNQLPSGRSPTDMATFVGPDGREKLLTVNFGERTIAIIDAATGAVTHVSVEGTVNRIHLFDAYDADTDTSEPYAMIYGEGTASPYVSFVRLMTVEDRLGQAVEVLDVGAGVERLVTSPVNGQVLVLHSGGNGISLLDLAGRFSLPLQAQANITDLVVDDAGQRLFAAFTNSSNISWVELASGQATKLPLDFTVTKLLWLPAARSLLALHAGQGGLLTALGMGDGSAAPTRQDARSYAGFYLEGITEVAQ